MVILGRKSRKTAGGTTSLLTNQRGSLRAVTYPNHFCLRRCNGCTRHKHHPRTRPHRQHASVERRRACRCMYDYIRYTLSAHLFGGPFVLPGVSSLEATRDSPRSSAVAIDSMLSESSSSASRLIPGTLDGAELSGDVSIAPMGRSWLPRAEDTIGPGGDGAVSAPAAFATGRLPSEPELVSEWIIRPGEATAGVSKDDATDSVAVPNGLPRQVARGIPSPAPPLVATPANSHFSSQDGG